MGEAEDGLSAAERVRANAEAKRQSQENLRQEQELLRASAEAARAKAEEARLELARNVSGTVVSLTELLERMESVEKMRRTARDGGFFE